MRIALLSCTKKKMIHECTAGEMYSPSTWFGYAREYVAVRQPPYDRWFILSAKYGLLLPSEMIEPYEKSLTAKGVTAEQRRRWAKRVLKQWDDLMGDRSLFPGPVARVDFYCGVMYREFLVPEIKKRGIKCGEPLKGLALGKQVGWFKARVEEER